jgi:20S proteasome subunit beta 7
MGCRVENECAEDSGTLDALEVHSYLTRVMYNRRNKFNPLWNDLVVAGIKGGKP